MKTLLVVDDLGPLIGSKNYFVKTGFSYYIRHLSRLLGDTAGNFPRQDLVIAAPTEVLNCFADAHLYECIPYDRAIDGIDWKSAGKIASQFSTWIKNSPLMHEAFPILYDRENSIPGIAYVRLGHLLCYDAVVHALLIERLISQHRVEAIAVLGMSSEIERIAVEVAKKHQLKAQVLMKDSFSQKLAKHFTSMLYERDRKIHALSEVQSKTTPPPPNFSKKNYIAFMPAHSLHFKTLIPLAKEVNQSGAGTSIVFLPHSLAVFEKQLKEEKIECCNLNSFTEAEDSKKFLEMQQTIVRSFPHLFQRSELHAELTFGQIDWSRVIKEKMYSFFKWSFSEIAILKQRFTRALDMIAPKAIFVFSDARFYEATAAAVGREMKIPVFFYSPNPIMALDEINRYDTGDFLFLGGPFIKEKIVANRYVEDSKIEIVGDVRFDEIDRWKSNEKILKTRQAFNISETKKVFLLVSWYTNLKFTLQEKELFFDMVWKVFKNHKDAMLIIKAHPNESESALRSFADSLGIQATIVKDVPLYELLAVSSGIITTASMTSLEAMMFDVPVLVVDLPNRDYDYYIPLKRGGGALSFKNSDELSHLVSELCSNADSFLKQVEKGREFIARYIARPKDGSAKQIIRILTQKIEGKQNQKVVAIIQARVSSARLPNKVLAQLSDKTVLEHVIERVKRAKLVDQVVVATSVEVSDNAIEALCHKKKIPCFRGSLENVLERYVEASQKFTADIVVRVTADSPLVEPRWIDQAVELLRAENADYSNAKLPEEFPIGMGCEVITRAALEKSLQNAKTKEDFEHVTWYCLSHRNQFKICFLSNSEKETNMNIRLALDEPNDLKLLEEIFKKLYSKNPNLGYREIVQLYRKSPGLFEVNQSVKENPNLYVRSLNNT